MTCITTSYVSAATACETRRAQCSAREAWYGDVPMTNATDNDARGDVVLYHIWPSHCSQKVRLCLAEKGVDYTSRIVNIGPPAENYEPWYARLNPDLVVPTLRHGDRVVTNSRRIVRYIDDTFDGPDLMPDGEEDRERVRELVDLADRLDIRAISYSTAPAIFTRWATSRRIEQLKRYRSQNPDLADAYTRKIEDVADWCASAIEPDELGPRQAEIATALDQVEQELADGPFIAGDQYTLADVLWTTVAARLEMLGAKDRIVDRPRFAAWFQRMKQRPSFEDANIWTKPRPLELLPIAAPYVVPRLLVAILLIGLGSAAILAIF